MIHFKKFLYRNFSYPVDRLRDFGTVAKPLWVILLFQVLVAVAFVGAPQGQDMLLTFLIDFGDKWFAFAWFLLALFFLSAVSEFGCRLIMYFSDLTTHELIPRRVRYRKLFQKHLSKAFLYAPVVFTCWAFLRAYLRLQKIKSMDSFQGQSPLLVLLLILLCLLLLIYLLYHLYQGKLRNRFYKLKLNRIQKYALTKLYSVTRERWIDGFIMVDGKPVKAQIKTGGAMFLAPIMNRFYFAFLIPAAVLILLFSFLPVSVYSDFGAVAIVCLSFACWITIYCALDILDAVQPLKRRFKIVLPYRFLLFVILIIVSRYNNDHPARAAAKKPTTSDERKLIHDYFDDWVEAKGFQNDSVIPVVFVSAEGGALRTGCFTSMMLARIQDSLPVFKNHIFCYSSVSGGTLGVNFFNALTQLPTLANNYKTTTRSFYNEDFLSATTGKLVFAEIINAFSPRMIPLFDRATALEKSWEQAFEIATGSKQNILAGNFSTVAGNPKNKEQAVTLINITEVESGHRTIWSNVLIDPVNFKEAIDLQKKSTVQLPYSTAISLSARFPLVSPAGAIEWKKGKPLHYVDGGYFENKGAMSIAEAIESVKKFSKYKDKVQVYVIQFNFSEEVDGEYRSLRFLNETTEILNAIMNVRSGHTNYSYEELFRNCNEYGAKLIPLSMPLDGHDVPMNWVLSDAALTRIEFVCDGMLRKDLYLQPLLEELRNLPK
jgi:hypothetical protein